MVERVHGAAVPKEFLTKDMDFFLLRTLVNITPTGNFADASQRAFEKLIETISTRAQPVIIGSVTATTEVDPVDLPAASGLGPVPVYNFRFAIEHPDAWTSPDISLEESLHGIAGFVYTTPTAGNNVSVTLTQFMI